MELDELGCLDAIEQAALVRHGDLPIQELISAAECRIEVLQPKTNALASRVARTGSMRDGCFSGVPSLVKDLTPWPGMATHYGSRLFRGAPVDEAGSEYTNALAAEGLVVLGKSATSEFGLLGTTESLANGPTRNPWNLDFSPGGSSGGAAAAVASGMVPVAHATDGGGSVRGPASFCGLFGFKPGRGASLETGMTVEQPPGRWLADHCLSRSVRDSAQWFGVTALDMDFRNTMDLLRGVDRPLRIGVTVEDAFARAPEEEPRRALDHAAGLLTDLGHRLEPVNLPHEHADGMATAYFDITSRFLSNMLTQIGEAMGIKRWNGLIEPYTSQITQAAARLTEDQIARALQILAASEDAFNRAVDRYDVILSPTVPIAPFRLGSHGPEATMETLREFTKRLAGYTFWPSLTGRPAMSVPLYWSATGMPIGIQCVGKPAGEAELFSLAFALEEACPWRSRSDQLIRELLCRKD